MKVGASVIAILVIAYFNVIKIINWFPDSDSKIKVRHYFTQRKTETLITSAESTGYSDIIWLGDDSSIRAGVISPDGMVWDKNAQIDHFINLAISLGLQGAIMTKRNGNWIFPEYTEIQYVDIEKTNYKTIKVSSGYGEYPELKICDDQLLKSEPQGRCIIGVSDKWYFQKTWFTLSLAQEET